MRGARGLAVEGKQYTGQIPQQHFTLGKSPGFKDRDGPSAKAPTDSAYATALSYVRIFRRRGNRIARF